MFTTSPEASKRDIHRAHQSAVEDYYTSKSTGLPNDYPYIKEDLDFIATLYENKVPLDAAIQIFIEKKSRKNPTSALKRSKTREELIDTSPEIRSISSSPTQSQSLYNTTEDQQKLQDLSQTEELINRILAVSDTKQLLSQYRDSTASSPSPSNKRESDAKHHHDLKREGKELYTYFLRTEHELTIID